ncbi:MAG: proline iminopeptidase-family hydrolase [Planctomycetota bacterium]|jgi:proline iminopeptidase
MKSRLLDISTNALRQLLILIILVCRISGSSFAQNISNQGANYAEVNGAKLYYEIHGSGEPLLLIPGGPGLSHLYFTPHFSKLADGFKIMYFDPYGRGKSDRAESTGQYSFQRDLDDLEGLRKFFRIDKLNIFGHSYGGILAQAYVLKHPEHVNKLVLSNTLYSSEMFQALIDNMNVEIQNQFPQVWEKLQIIHAKRQKSSTPEYLMAASPVTMQLAYFYDISNMTKLVGNQFSFNPDVYFSLAGDDSGFVPGGDLANWNYSEQLKDITVPTLIIAGRFDRGCFPKYTLQFKKFMPQAEFVMFEKSGHFPFIEEPQKFHETLVNFLRQEKKVK